MKRKELLKHILIYIIVYYFHCVHLNIFWFFILAGFKLLIKLTVTR